MFSCPPIINEGGESDFGYYWSSTSAYFGPPSPEYYYGWYVAFGLAPAEFGNDMHGAGAVRRTVASGVHMVRMSSADGEDVKRITMMK